MPETPEVEVPSKPASATISPAPKEVIKIDDESEIQSGNNGAGADSGMGLGEKTQRKAEATAHDALVQLKNSTSATVSAKPSSPILRSAPISQRYEFISNMMDQVWGKEDSEQADLNDLQDAISIWITKHKNMRKVNYFP